MIVYRVSSHLDLFTSQLQPIMTSDDSTALPPYLKNRIPLPITIVVSTETRVQDYRVTLEYRSSDIVRIKEVYYVVSRWYLPCICPELRNYSLSYSLSFIPFGRDDDDILDAEMLNLLEYTKPGLIDERDIYRVYIYVEEEEEEKRGR